MSNKILVVDDESGVRSLFQEALTRFGYDVTVAANGEQAISLAKTQEFEIAFLDIKMAGLNGVETLKALKKISPALQAVMITGYAGEDLVSESFSEGAFVCLPKPFGIAKIIETVRALTGGQDAELEPEAEEALA